MSPLSFCLNNPARLSDNERIRRFLTSTSYNCASITHLALACGLPQLDTEDERIELAKSLLDVEKTLETDVFIRTLTVNVTETTINLTVRVTDLDKVEQRVKDHPSYHLEQMVISQERNHPGAVADTPFLTLFLKEVTALLSERRQRMDAVELGNYSWLKRVADNHVVAPRNDSDFNTWDTVRADELTEQFNRILLNTGRLIFTTRSISCYSGNDAVTLRRPTLSMPTTPFPTNI